MKRTTATATLSREWIPYVAPFAVFSVVTYAGPLFNLSPGQIYLIRMFLTASTLYLFRNNFKQEIVPVFSWPAVLAGALVFFIWVLPENLYPHIGSSEFNPYADSSGMNPYLLMTIRLTGAALLVPVMEELFWRSFAMRLMIRSDFKSVPLGAFTWFSFIIVSVAFGFEHHRWLVGIAAGAIYAWVLYRSKNLFEPILAHAVTNLMLGIYVIQSGEWSFW